MVNPQRLYLPYIKKTKEDNILIEEKKQAINAYIKRKGLQTKVYFTPLKGKTEILSLIDDLGDKAIYLEKNKIEIIDDSDINEKPFKMGVYTFNMKNTQFTSIQNADWLNYTKHKISITVQDLLCFLGRKTPFEIQPYYRKEIITTLFNTYVSDRETWKGICKILGKKENKASFFVRISLHGAELQQYTYISPYYCRGSIEELLNLLKTYRIIGQDSYVSRHSSDSCKTIVYSTRSCSGALKQLFSIHRVLLPTTRFYISENGKGSFILYCDGLEVPRIQYDLNIDKEEKKRRMLEKLQESGLIQFDSVSRQGTFSITYGSRQIKDLFLEEGKLLEAFVFYKLKECNFFDDVVTGIESFNEESKENEMDCFITKGFQTMIVECKARKLEEKEKEEIVKAKRGLNKKLQKYGINSRGILIIDSEKDVPCVDNYNNIIVCSDSEDILEIGKTIKQYFK